MSSHGRRRFGGASWLRKIEPSVSATEHAAPPLTLPPEGVPLDGGLHSSWDGTPLYSTPQQLRQLLVNCNVDPRFLMEDDGAAESLWHEIELGHSGLRTTTSGGFKVVQRVVQLVVCRILGDENELLLELHAKKIDRRCFASPLAPLVASARIGESAEEAASWAFVRAFRLLRADASSEFAVSAVDAVRGCVRASKGIEVMPDLDDVHGSSLYLPSIRTVVFCKRASIRLSEVEQAFANEPVLRNLVSWLPPPPPQSFTVAHCRHWKWCGVEELASRARPRSVNDHCDERHSIDELAQRRREMDDAVRSFEQELLRSDAAARTAVLKEFAEKWRLPQCELESLLLPPSTIAKSAVATATAAATLRQGLLERKVKTSGELILSKTDKALVARLFCDCASVTVRKLTGGFSGAVVLHGRSSRWDGSEERPSIVKLDRQDRLRAEYDKMSIRRGEHVPAVLAYAAESFDKDGLESVIEESAGVGASSTIVGNGKGDSASLAAAYLLHLVSPERNESPVEFRHSSRKLHGGSECWPESDISDDGDYMGLDGFVCVEDDDDAVDSGVHVVNESFDEDGSELCLFEESLGLNTSEVDSGDTVAKSLTLTTTRSSLSITSSMTVSDAGDTPSSVSSFHTSHGHKRRAGGFGELGLEKNRGLRGGLRMELCGARWSLQPDLVQSGAQLLCTFKQLFRTEMLLATGLGSADAYASSTLSGCNGLQRPMLPESVQLNESNSDGGHETAQLAFGHVGAALQDAFGEILDSPAIRNGVRFRRLNLFKHYDIRKYADRLFTEDDLAVKIDLAPIAGTIGGGHGRGERDVNLGHVFRVSVNTDRKMEEAATSVATVAQVEVNAGCVKSELNPALPGSKVAHFGEGSVVGKRKHGSSTKNVSSLRRSSGFRVLDFKGALESFDDEEEGLDLEERTANGTIPSEPVHYGATEFEVSALAFLEYFCNLMRTVESVQLPVDGSSDGRRGRHHIHYGLEPVVSSHFMRTTHGDLNGENLLVDSQEMTWIIDWPSMGHKHCLMDLAKLESCVLLEYLPLLSLGDFSQALRISSVLSSAHHLGARLPSAEDIGLFGKFAFAWEVISMLRIFVGSYVREDTSPAQLSFALIGLSLKALKYKDTSPLQKRLALATAVLHAHRLLLTIDAIADAKADSSGGNSVHSSLAMRKALETSGLVFPYRKTHFHALLSSLTPTDLQCTRIWSLNVDGVEHNELENEQSPTTSLYAYRHQLRLYFRDALRARIVIDPVSREPVDVGTYTWCIERCPREDGSEDSDQPTAMASKPTLSHSSTSMPSDPVNLSPVSRREVERDLSEQRRLRHDERLRELELGVRDGQLAGTEDDRFLVDCFGDAVDDWERCRRLLIVAKPAQGKTCLLNRILVAAACNALDVPWGNRDSGGSTGNDSCIYDEMHASGVLPGQDGPSSFEVEPLLPGRSEKEANTATGSVKTTHTRHRSDPPTAAATRRSASPRGFLRRASSEGGVLDTERHQHVFGAGPCESSSTANNGRVGDRELVKDLTRSESPNRLPDSLRTTANVVRDNGRNRSALGVNDHEGMSASSMLSSNGNAEAISAPMAMTAPHKSLDNNKGRPYFNFEGSWCLFARLRPNFRRNATSLIISPQPPFGGRHTTMPDAAALYRLRGRGFHGKCSETVVHGAAALVYHTSTCACAGGADATSRRHHHHRGARRASQIDGHRHVLAQLVPVIVPLMSIARMHERNDPEQGRPRGKDELLLKFLRRQYGAHSSRYKFLLTAYINARLLICLDAIDEAGSASTQSTLRDWIVRDLAASGNRIIVTARKFAKVIREDSGGIMPGFVRVELKPLSSDMVEALVRRRMLNHPVEDVAAVMKLVRSQEYGGLIESPLLVSVLINAFRSEQRRWRRRRRDQQEGGIADSPVLSLSGVFEHGTQVLMTLTKRGGEKLSANSDHGTVCSGGGTRLRRHSTSDTDEIDDRDELQMMLGLLRRLSFSLHLERRRIFHVEDCLALLPPDPSLVERLNGLLFSCYEGRVPLLHFQNVVPTQNDRVPGSSNDAAAHHVNAVGAIAPGVLRPPSSNSRHWHHRTLAGADGRTAGGKFHLKEGVFSLVHLVWQEHLCAVYVHSRLREAHNDSGVPGLRSALIWLLRSIDAQRPVAWYQGEVINASSDMDELRATFMQSDWWSPVFQRVMDLCGEALKLRMREILG